MYAAKLVSERNRANRRAGRRNGYRGVRMDLQAFANPNTNVTTQPSLSVEMKTHYDMELIEYAEPALVHDQFAQTRNIPRRKGKRIEFRRFTKLPKALVALVEGITPDGRTMEAVALEAEVSQYGDYITTSDVIDMTAIDPVVLEATRLLGSQAGVTADTITRDILNGGTNMMFSKDKTNPAAPVEVLSRANINKNCYLTLDDIRIAAGYLKRVNAPKFNGLNYVAIIHPDTETDIIGMDGFTEVQKYTDNVEKVYKGEIGMLYSVRFVVSTEAKVIGPKPIFGAGTPYQVSRMHLQSAASSTTLTVQEAITAEQAAEFNARIAGGETINFYVNGNLVKINAATAGAAGAATFTANASVTAPAGALVAGDGAGKDGSAIYTTMIVAENAYGTTTVDGGGLETIVKPLGSAGSADPLNQRATVGWKLLKTAVRLIEEYMIRIEHGGLSFDGVAEMN